MAVPVVPAPPGALTAATERDTARAVALLVEGLLTEKEFGALTGIAPQDLPQLLADTTKLAEIQRISVELRNAGTLARLEALGCAREAVTVAAEIMRNSEMHPATRLNAATYISKVAGTERAVADDRSKATQVSIRINLGSEPEDRLVIEGSAEPQMGGDESD